MTKNIAIASIFQRVTVQEFAKIVEDIQISVIVAIAVCTAGLHRRLNYLPNMMNLSCWNLQKTGINYIKLERQGILMLKLDEKKIRKGKPIGLPYQGSKKKISKKIIEIIKQNFGTDKPIYDIYGGGGAITAECILNGLEVYFND